MAPSCRPWIDKTMDRRYEDHPAAPRPHVESTQPLVSIDGRAEAPESPGEARPRPPLQVDEDRLLVRARAVHRAALLLDRARVRVRDRALRAVAWGGLCRPLRADLLGDRAAGGAVAPARRDAHPVRATRRRDRNRADRAPRLGSGAAPVDTGRPNGE